MYNYEINLNFKLKRLRLINLKPITSKNIIQLENNIIEAFKKFIKLNYIAIIKKHQPNEKKKNFKIDKS